MKQIAGIFLMAFALCASSAIVNAQQNKAEQMYQQALYEMEGKGEYAKAIGLFNRVAAQFPKEKSVGAKALLHVGMCQEKLGKSEATKAYERVIRDFADQKDAVKEARERLSLLKQQTSSIAETGTSLRQVWKGRGVSRWYGQSSPDGRYISSSDEEDTGCLAVIDVTTGTKRVFPNPGMGDKSFEVCQSAWSPDSKRLAYEVQDYEARHVELHIVGVDGSGDRVLYRKADIWWLQSLEWSPDGKHLLTACRMRDSLVTQKLVLVSTEDGSMRVLKSLDTWNGQLSSIFKFSPDGRLILYSSPAQRGSAKCDILLLSTDGSKETRLTHGPANDRAIGWSPGGEKVIYISDRSGSEDLWALRVVNEEAQGEPERIRANVGQIRPLGITRNGSLLFFSPRQNHTSDIFFATIDPQSGKLVAPQQLATRGFYGVNNPLGWSPDGKQLLYKSDSYRTWLAPNNMGSLVATALFTLSFGDRKEHEIKLPVRQDRMIAARWSSVENDVLVRGKLEDEKEDLSLVNVESGETKPIKQKITSTIERPLSISPDRKTLYFVRPRSIVAHNLDNGTERVLDSTLNGILPFAMVSPSWDGKNIAFQFYSGRSTNSVIVMPTSGGKPREVYRTNRAIGMQSICWSRDGKYIYFTQSAKQPNKVELWRIPVEGGAPQQTGLSGSNLWALEFHPDGKTLVFSSTDDELPMEIWALDNLLQNQKAVFGARSTAPQNRHVWTGKDVNTEGSPSPDGRYVSYTDNKKNSLAIYDLKSEERTILPNPDSTRKGMSVDESIWSPDGRQLAYSLNDEEHQAEIHMVNVDGTGHRRLCSLDTTDAYIEVEDWSRDGKMILAIFYGAPMRLGVVSVDDGSIRFITIPHAWSSQKGKMFFSPDGRFVTYTCSEQRESSSDVFVAAVDGSGEINLTQNAADDIVFGWAPAGNRILFASNRSGSYDLWSVEMENGKQRDYPRLVKNNIGKVTPMGSTNDGSLYYSVPANEYWASYVPESNIYVASLDPQTGKVLSPPVAATMHNNGFNYSLPWSPDGKKLLYFSYSSPSRTAPRKMFVLSPETGTETEIPNQFGSDSLMGLYKVVSQFAWSSWFPDGKHLAVWAQLQNGNKGICKMEIQTGRLMPLISSTKADLPYFTPSISPDGKKLFFQEWLGAIYSYDLESKTKRLVFQCRKDQYLHSLRLSSDGGQLAFVLAGGPAEGSAALMVLSTSGGEPHAILQLEETRGDAFLAFSPFGGVAWSPDGKFIYIAKRIQKGAPYEVYRIPVQGGIPEPTGLSKEGLRFISIRPDGKAISFTTGIEPKPGIWVLENVFGEEGKGKK